MDSMKLNEKLLWLQEMGCFPSIYLRGKVWRAHVNASGNFWEESDTPLKALTLAISTWIAAGRPMDGAASDIQNQRG